VIGWLNPVSGLSGDMLLGALLDLGASRAMVTEAVASTGLTGWGLTVVDVHRAGIRATHARVEVTDTDAIQALAEVESGIHGVPAADVHLHELGGVDTIVDVVGVAAGVHDLGITELWSSPLALGVGTTDSAHGLLPVPAPATLALLRDVPVHGIDVGFETVTPTGAALLRALGCRYDGSRHRLRRRYAGHTRAAERAARRARNHGIGVGGAVSDRDDDGPGDDGGRRHR
jgi:uncharacterized protein (DUF111 family)